MPLPDYTAMPVSELEKACGPQLIQLYRRICPDPDAYRLKLLDFLQRPRIPIDEIMATIRDHKTPSAAWREILSVCSLFAPKAPWQRLENPDIQRDIRSVRRWLRAQLSRLGTATGLYLGLDTLNMHGDGAHNVEIGGSTKCDPQSDSQSWLSRGLNYGSEHLIRGLLDLHAEYDTAIWKRRDEKIPSGSASAFADYAVFLAYSGIVLGHALKRIKVSHSLVAVWGFHDGDLFLLGRLTPDNFEFVCR